MVLYASTDGHPYFARTNKISPFFPAKPPLGGGGGPLAPEAPRPLRPPIS